MTEASVDKIIECPTCHNPDVRVEAVGATWRYGDHSVPGTESTFCDTSGGGIGSHNMKKVRLK